MSKMHKAWNGSWAILSLLGITFGALALAGILYFGPASNAQAVRDATVSSACSLTGCDNRAMAVVGVLLVAVPLGCWQLFKYFWTGDREPKGHPDWYVAGYAVLCSILAVSILWMPAPSHSGRGNGPPEVVTRPEAASLEGGMGWGVLALIIAAIAVRVLESREATRQRTVWLVGLVPFLLAAIVAAARA
ncbi:hypothetical protein [Paractinoplanes lichenicola]|uniref:Uncharacterized protein n=1 Tax=Paractinoplanes lichenicola TaxID=2802976 RepID=A0ABS1VHC3_9ACTN|nr:hypothetical protein [Actinoplanes lichenicola]MBL7253881.1 hypothetical protein [Actinoplanes lichenicola]